MRERRTGTIRVKDKSTLKPGLLPLDGRTFEFEHIGFLDFGEDHDPYPGQTGG